MRILRSLAALLLVLGLFFVNVPTALALPPLPSSFYGTVTLNGANIPVGAQVSAWINGVQYALSHSTLYHGTTIYSLDVPGDDLSTPGTIEGGVEGDTVVFFIRTCQATQTGTWHGGTDVRLDLTVTSCQLPYLVYLPLLKR
jgi:hypothetical protein